VSKIFEDFLSWMVVIFDNFLILGDSYEDLADKTASSYSSRNANSE